MIRTLRSFVLAVAVLIAGFAAAAAPAGATSRPPYCSNPFCYSYIKTHPDGTREQCNVYWDGTEQCRELHAIPRWTYNPWAGWRLNWLWVL